MTIKEFARRIGVSTATVSRAFTEGARIHTDTRAHILEQARLLGYAPNPNARSLAQRRNRLIGIDYPGNPDVLGDLYLVELARGVQAAVQRADYGLLFNTLPRPGGDMELLREWVFGRAVDGVVIVISPRFPMETLTTLANRDVPCVVITPGPLKTPIPLPTLILDLAEGAQAAMTHLRRLGHERIGFLSSTPNDAVQTLYSDVLQADGLYDPRLVIETASTIAEGRAAMHRLLAAPQRPSAVFCRTDVLALGALRAARDMGLRVPEDISLIGHDDIVLVELSDPALTTIRIDTARIGQLAAQMLLDARALADRSHDAPPSHATPPVLTVGTELIVRASTGPVTHAVAVARTSYTPRRVPT